MRGVRANSPAAGLGAVLCVVALSACADGAQLREMAFSGTWESESVILERGDFTETYQFIVTIEEGASEGILDITYTVTGAPDSERTLRQDISVTREDGRIVLTGSDPRLVAGPEIVGVYEPDVLYCGVPPDGFDSLECGWGSDAHGRAPRVRLARRGP